MGSKRPSAPPPAPPPPPPPPPPAPTSEGRPEISTPIDQPRSDKRRKGTKGFLGDLLGGNNNGTKTLLGE